MAYYKDWKPDFRTALLFRDEKLMWVRSYEFDLQDFDRLKAKGEFDDECLDDYNATKRGLKLAKASVKRIEGYLKEKYPNNFSKYLKWASQSGTDNPYRYFDGDCMVQAQSDFCQKGEQTMALNKRRNASVSASTSAPATSPTETSPAPAQNADFAALQTALASIVQLVTQLNETVTKQASELSDLTAKLDAIEAAMDEEDEEDEDTDENEEDEEDEDGEEDGDDYTADDIDPAKVNEQLRQFDANEQKEILSLAMKSLGTNRLNPRIIAKDANAAYAVAEVLCSEKFGCDVEDMVKD